MEQLFKKYLNVQKMLVTYRKYQVKEKFLNYEDFKSKIHNVEYIEHTAVKHKEVKQHDIVKNGENIKHNKNSKNNEVHIYLFKKDSAYVKSTPHFKKLIDKLSNKDPVDVIIISKDPLSVYINKSMIKYKNLNIYNYLHRHFILDPSEGPSCSPHRIMTPYEIDELCAKQLMVHPFTLPTIYVTDPLAIYIGATVGDVVEIKAISEIAGYVNRYRIVVPKNGKVLQNMKLKSHDVDSMESDTKKIEVRQSRAEQNNPDDPNIKNIDATENIDDIDDIDDSDGDADINLSNLETNMLIGNNANNEDNEDNED